MWVYLIRGVPVKESYHIKCWHQCSRRFKSGGRFAMLLWKKKSLLQFRFICQEEGAMVWCFPNTDPFMFSVSVLWNRFAESFKHSFKTWAHLNESYQSSYPLIIHQQKRWRATWSRWYYRDLPVHNFPASKTITPNNRLWNQKITC